MCQVINDGIRAGAACIDTESDHRGQSFLLIISFVYIIKYIYKEKMYLELFKKLCKKAGEAADLTILYHACTIESDSKRNCQRKLHKIDDKGSL